MAVVQSSWANQQINIDGTVGAEWNGAGVLPIPAGFLTVKNNAQYLYLVLDMVGDQGSDAGTGDYFWFSVDVDQNTQITANKDVNYGLYPGQPNKIGRQYYLGPGTWTGLLNQPTTSAVHIGFGSSPKSATPHRIWELRLALSELGVDLGADPAVLRFGLRVASTNPSFTFDYPGGFYQNFTNLHKIYLKAQSPYPPGTAGAVIAGVGLIPAGQISNDGYATTAPSYYLHADDSAFAGRMNLLGNRVTLQNLWNQGASVLRLSF
jgi:hypothetical protein